MTGHCPKISGKVRTAREPIIARNIDKTNCYSRPVAHWNYFGECQNNLNVIVKSFSCWLKKIGLKLWLFAMEWLPGQSRGLRRVLRTCFVQTVAQSKPNLKVCGIIFFKRQVFLSCFVYLFAHFVSCFRSIKHMRYSTEGVAFSQQGLVLTFFLDGI